MPRVDQCYFSDVVNYISMDIEKLRILTEMLEEETKMLKGLNAFIKWFIIVCVFIFTAMVIAIIIAGSRK